MVGGQLSSAAGAAGCGRIWDGKADCWIVVILGVRHGDREDALVAGLHPKEDRVGFSTVLMDKIIVVFFK